MLLRCGSWTEFWTLFHHFLLNLRTLYIVWCLVRRRVIRRLTRFQTMCNILKYRKILLNGALRLRCVCVYFFNLLKTSTVCHHSSSGGTCQPISAQCSHIRYCSRFMLPTADMLIHLALSPDTRACFKTNMEIFSRRLCVFTTIFVNSMSRRIFGPLWGQFVLLALPLWERSLKFHITY